MSWSDSMHMGKKAPRRVHLQRRICRIRGPVVLCRRVEDSGDFREMRTIIIPLTQRSSSGGPNSGTLEDYHPGIPFILFFNLHWDFSNYTGSLSPDGESLYLAPGSWQAEFFASINIWWTSFFSFLLLFFLFFFFLLFFFLFLFKIHPYPECVSFVP